MAIIFRVAGFASAKHPKGIRFGEKLVETTHTSEVSAYVEIEAWKARMEKGDVAYASLVDLRPGSALTNLRIYPHTKIAWSWLKHGAK